MHGGVDRVFSHKVRDYQLARPDYPDTLFETLRRTGALPDHAVVADIGAGTGLLTQGLLARGHRAIAVEPNAEMRAAADAVLSGHPLYSSRPGSAEDCGLQSGGVDLVVAAQAFHWFNVPLARAECLRILTPAGRVALVWNDRVLEDPLNQALDQLFSRFGGSRRLATVASEERRHVPEFFGSGAFEQHEMPHAHRLSREALVALVFSRSYMPPRDSAAGVEAERGTAALFDRFARDDSVQMRYQTLVIIGRPALPG